MCVFEEGFGGAETDELRKINKYICDFSRGGLNARLRARIQTLLRGHKYALFISLSSARWQLGKSVGEI